MLPTKLQVNLPFDLREEAKHRFSILPPLRLFGSEEEAKNRFSRWPSWRPSWISDMNNFSYLLSTSSLFRVNGSFYSEEVQNRFSRWQLWQPSRFLIGGFKLFFLSKDTSMILTKFPVNWPFGSGEEAMAAICGFPIGTILAFFFFFLSTSHPYASYQISNGLSVQEKIADILDFR